MIFSPPELLQLATSAVTIAFLTESAKEVGKGIAKEIGKDIYTKIKDIFNGDKKSEEVLAQYEAKPSEEGKEALIEELALALKSKPEDTEALNTIVNNYNLSQNVSIKSRDFTQTTIIQNQNITGIDPEKYADVLTALKEVKKDLESITQEKAQFHQTQQLSVDEIIRLKSELEKERNKGTFTEKIKDQLRDFDAHNNFADAEKLLKEQIAEKQKKELAETYFQIGGYASLQLKYSDALKYYIEASELDPSNLLYLNEAGFMTLTLGIHKDAILIFEKAVKIHSNNNEVEDEVYPILCNNLGMAWKISGDYEKAIFYYSKALEIEIRLYDSLHPKIAIRYNNIGCCLDEQGKPAEAINYYNKALKIHLISREDSNAHIATVYSNLGAAWHNLGDFKQAKELYIISLNLDIDTYGFEHPTIAIRLNNIGLILQDQSKYKEALVFYNDALEIYQKRFDSGHPNMALVYSNMAHACYKLNDKKKAKENLESAIRTFELFPSESNLIRASHCRDNLLLLNSN
ncbi:MAG: domain family protein [Bacteroidetes bacterium]|nr:domain family protein [Bacteroidota bacterium]